MDVPIFSTHFFQFSKIFLCEFITFLKVIKQQVDYSHFKCVEVKNYWKYFVISVIGDIRNASFKKKLLMFSQLQEKLMCNDPLCFQTFLHLTLHLKQLKKYVCIKYRWFYRNNCCLCISRRKKTCLIMKEAIVNLFEENRLNC